MDNELQFSKLERLKEILANPSILLDMIQLEPVLDSKENGTPFLSFQLGKYLVEVLITHKYNEELNKELDEYLVEITSNGIDYNTYAAANVGDVIEGLIPYHEEEKS